MSMVVCGGVNSAVRYVWVWGGEVCVGGGGEVCVGVGW